MVAAIHTNPYAPWREYRFPWVRIAVPIFFVLSSFFLWTKLNADRANADHTVKRFLLRDLKLYWAWFLALLPVTLYINRYFTKGLWNGLKEIAIGFFFGSTFRASWFLSALIISVLIIYIASKKLSNKILFISGLSINILCCLMFAYGGLWSSRNWMTILRNAYPFPMCNSFPVALVWIVMGKLLAENRNRLLAIRHPFVGFGVSCVFLWLEHRLVTDLNWVIANDCYILLIPTVFFAVICMLRSDIAIPNAKFLRSASTVIYCSHYSVCFVEGAVIRALGFDLMGTIGGTLQFICAVLTGILMTFVFKQLETVKGFRWVKYFY